MSINNLNNILNQLDNNNINQKLSHQFKLLFKGLNLDFKDKKLLNAALRRGDICKAMMCFMALITKMMKSKPQHHYSDIVETGNKCNLGSVNTYQPKVENMSVMPNQRNVNSDVNLLSNNQSSSYKIHAKQTTIKAFKASSPKKKIKKDKNFQYFAKMLKAQARLKAQIIKLNSEVKETTTTTTLNYHETEELTDIFNEHQHSGNFNFNNKKYKTYV